MLSRTIGTIFAVAFLLTHSLLFADPRQAQPSPPSPAALSGDILARVPSAYREEARSMLTATDQVQGSLRRKSDDGLSVWIVESLARKPEAADFLISQLEKEPSPKLRSEIITSLRPHWQLHPETQQIVVHHVVSDPDASVALQAMDVLRSIQMVALDRLLETRLTAAKAAADNAAVKEFAVEEERWFSLKEDIMLPAFLRIPPPVFSVAPLDRTIRVLAFGDFGTGSAAQKQTAAAMVEFNKTHPFDFGLTMGDNFYPQGMVSPSDPRWQTQWEQLYGPLGIKFYATLGNHDWSSADSPAAEILYTDKSPSWRMPAPYYTFTAGPVQFFAFDTQEDSEAEREWLDSELSKSTARWKVVYGHYHIFSATRGDNKELIEKLLPVLEKNHVDIYLNGHDHNLQELKPEGGVHFFVSGGGGAGLYNLNTYDRSIYKQKVNGFTVLEAGGDYFKISFIGTDGNELHQVTLTKKP